MNNHRADEGKINKITWSLAIIIAMVPLVVRLREVQIPELVKGIWDNGSGTYGDFFSANKVVVLGIAAIIGIGFFVAEYIRALPYKGTKLELQFYKNKAVYTCISIYAGFAILSTLLASKGQRSLALFGAPGRYEGLIAILFYIASMLLAIHVSQEWWNIKFLYKALTVGGFIVGMIGIGQFLGFDIFQTTTGKTLMLPLSYQHLADQVNFAFDGRVYGTFFNPNYVGSYAAMLMPLSIVGLIYAYTYEKKIYKKLVTTLFSLAMLALWLIPLSRGGLLGGGVALIIIFALLFRKVIKNKGQGVILIGILIITSVAANTFSKGAIANRLRTLPKEAVGFLAKDDTPISQLEDIKLEQNAVEIISNLPPIRIEKEGDTLVLKDSLGEAIPIIQDGKIITPEDSKYEGLYITNNLPEGFLVRIINPNQGTYYMNFVPTSDGIRVVGSNGELITMEPVAAWGFKGKEKLGSSRAYIWSRTFPMIKDTWFLGYGPDTYVVRFPQHDVIGKVVSFESTRTIVDKPHNLYLQIMSSTGMVSLLAFLGLFITYCVLWFKQMRRADEDDIRRWMSIGIFAAISGYLVAGLFNDSVVSVAPVFWVLWGLGIGLTNSVDSSPTKVN